MKIARSLKLAAIRNDIAIGWLSYSRDLTVHTAALRKLILQGKTTPEAVGATIFDRAINFKPASILPLYDSRLKEGVPTESGCVHPHGMDINRRAIKEYKALIASLPREVRDKWDEAIAQKLIDLGKAEYRLSSFSSSGVPTVIAPLIELSFEVSKLLNELGLR